MLEFSVRTPYHFEEEYRRPLVCQNEETGRLQTGQTTTVFFPFATMGAQSSSRMKYILYVRTSFL